jgi:hypothetical protein
MEFSLGIKDQGSSQPGKQFSPGRTTQLFAFELRFGNSAFRNFNSDEAKTCLLGNS